MIDSEPQPNLIEPNDEDEFGGDDNEYVDVEEDEVLNVPLLMIFKCLFLENAFLGRIAADSCYLIIM